MNVAVEGKNIDITAGESILCALRRAGTDFSNPAEKPVAAMIGGEVFNLNYTPKRECSIRLLRYGDDEGRRVYERTLQFVLIIAVRKLFPGARLVTRYSAGDGLYITVEKAGTGAPLNEADTDLLRSEMKRITAAAYPFVRRRLDVRDAIEFYTKDGQQDKAELLRCRRFSYFDVYSCPDYSDYMDYFYGEMTPSTDYVHVFELHTLPEAIVMLLPSKDDPAVPAKYENSPKLLAVFAESDRWGRLMHVANAVDLNRRVENGTVRGLMKLCMKRLMRGLRMRLLPAVQKPLCLPDRRLREKRLPQTGSQPNCAPTDWIRLCCRWMITISTATEFRAILTVKWILSTSTLWIFRDSTGILRFCLTAARRKFRCLISKQASVRNKARC